MTEQTFAELGLRPELLKSIERMGYESPSLIQVQAIPASLRGGDLIGLSQTGSGKTAAFVLPILQKLECKLRRPQALVVCPTRELAVQVCEEANRLGADLEEFKAVPIYGGAPIDRQIRSLKAGAQLVVGTPGRIIDLLKRKAIRTEGIATVVLDEADRMLDMGFREEVEGLLAAMPADRQTLFFSATMNRGVKGLIERFGKSPETISVEHKAVTVDSIEQVAYEVRNRSKVEVLSRVLDLEDPRLAIVFCNTKRVVDETTEAMLARGYAVERLHGDITQTLRERTLKRFREGKVEVLLATDVAARGIDVDDVELVVNFDLPNDPEDYVHRIGRTGRAGRSGKAVSFVFGRDVYRLEQVERYTRQSIRRDGVPSQELVEGKRADQLLEAVKEKLEGGKLASYENLTGRLLDSGHTATDICNALFSLLKEGQGREGQSIAEDSKHEQAWKKMGKEKSGRERKRSDRKNSGDKRSERGQAGGAHLFRDEHGNARDRRGERLGKGGKKAGGHPSGPPLKAGWVRLFVNVGKEDGTQAGEIAGMLYREGNLPDGSLGKIQVARHFTLVDVQEDHARGLIQSVTTAKLRGRKVRLDFDRNKD